MAAPKIAFPPELSESALDREIAYLERLVSEVIEANLRFCECGKDRDGHASVGRMRVLLEVLPRTQSISAPEGFNPLAFLFFLPLPSTEQLFNFASLFQPMQRAKNR